MASFTALLGLRKPAGPDLVNVTADISDAMDKIDDAFDKASFLGEVRFTAAGVAPNAKWLLMQGQAISRVVYADLFALIGTTFGAGDGVNTFNIPDARETTIMGASGTRARGPASAIPTHGHADTIAINNDNSNTAGGGANHVHDVIGNTGGETNPGGMFHTHGYPRGADISVAGVTDGPDHNLTHGHALNFQTGGKSSAEADHSHNFVHGHGKAGGVTAASATTALTLHGIIRVLK